MKLHLFPATIADQANSGVPPKGEIERMARRRYQQPTPVKHGRNWTVVIRRDHFEEGAHVRRQQRVVLGPIAGMTRQQARVAAAEVVAPINGKPEEIGGGVLLKDYIEKFYRRIAIPRLAKTTQDRYEGVLDQYLIPSLGSLCLRQLTPMALDGYLSGLDRALSWESRAKVRTVLSAVLRLALTHELIKSNPLEKLKRERKPRAPQRPYITPEQFDQLITLVPEPYATMVYVAVYTGLRVSELAGLRWNDVHQDSISVDERYCRGDWGAPKSEASYATIGVTHGVIERIHRMKLATVEVKAGRATRRYKLVKAEGPTDLVFQSVKKGRPMRDNNILSRHIKPAARKMNLDWLNWRALRTSHATWLKLAGADVKDCQAQMRHSRVTTTLEIYQQFVPEAQRRAVDKLEMLTKTIQ